MVDIVRVRELILEAGKAILEVYRTPDFQVTSKEDRSPLTLADSRSHEILSRGLRSLYPRIPLLSEEGKEIPYSVRRQWPLFWLVDPLDGTKEFIKRNDEFTVNVALVEDRKPVLGFIYLPVFEVLYLGDIRQGCWEIRGDQRRSLKVSPLQGKEPVRVVKSRSHPSPQVEELLGLLPSHRAMDRGSALKFCALASGEADFYPRLGPTWEWDTGAGHAIVQAAGGVMVDPFGNPLLYNKPKLLNGPFLAAGSLEWLQNTGLLEKASNLMKKKLS
ncbi:MAG: 3'(2'),5'-bisphosphate nucleotidase CysQ [Syntrophobacteraceae bacterium]|nr:3'(2'),5'-bisphosphate nucleotidase CysQ [Syntrophobacteraceae bacterium]